MEPREPGGEPTKVPYNACTGAKASANKESTWASFDEAVQAMQSGDYTGIGFEFAPPYVGIDLDKCRHKAAQIQTRYLYSRRSALPGQPHQTMPRLIPCWPTP